MPACLVAVIMWKGDVHAHLLCALWLLQDPALVDHHLVARDEEVGRIAAWLRRAQPGHNGVRLGPAQVQHQLLWARAAVPQGALVNVCGRCVETEVVLLRQLLHDGLPGVGRGAQCDPEAGPPEQRLQALVVRAGWGRHV